MHSLQEKKPKKTAERKCCLTKGCTKQHWLPSFLPSSSFTFPEQAFSGVFPSLFLKAPSVFHLDRHGHSASCFHCYINETNPRCVRNVGDMKKKKKGWYYFSIKMWSKYQKACKGWYIWTIRGWFLTTYGEREEIKCRRHHNVKTLF